MNNFFSKIRKIILFNRFYCYSEYKVDILVRRFAGSISGNPVVLDAGAGQCRFKPYFGHTRYIAQDNCIGDPDWDFSKIEIKSEIYDIPLGNASIDIVLCIEVLEHLKYPYLAIKEFSRLLKPGGQLFIVCPFAWKEHQKPHDFYRFTKYILKQYASEYGFEAREMNCIGGKYVTIGQMINDLSVTLKIMQKSRILFYLLILLLYPIKFFIGFICYFLDILDTQKDLTLQYQCLFIKK